MTEPKRLPYPVTTLSVTAGLVVIAVVGLAAAGNTGVIDNELAKRASGVAWGVLLMVLGNFLPKVARPFGAPGGSAGTAAAERLAGWIFVLAGMGYIAAWLLAPETYGMLVSSLIGLGAFAAAILVWLWLTRDGSGHDEADAGAPRPKGAFAARRIMFVMLHAVFWSFAMFLAASLWQAKIVPWLAVAFTLANSGLAVCLVKSGRKL